MLTDAFPHISTTRPHRIKDIPSPWSFSKAVCMRNVSYVQAHRIVVHLKSALDCIYFQCLGTPLPMLFRSEPPELRLVAESRLVHAGDLYDRCQSHHLSCSTAKPELPRRALSVGTSTEGIHLLEVVPGTRGRYAALSYCWGGKTPLLCSTKATIPSHLQHIEWESLPSVFQDAIQVTRRVKLELIWIDALCIIQDDLIDWEWKPRKWRTSMAKQHSQYQPLLHLIFDIISGSEISSRYCSNGNTSIWTFNYDNCKKRTVWHSLIGAT